MKWFDIIFLFWKKSLNAIIQFHRRWFWYHLFLDHWVFQKHNQKDKSGREDDKKDKSDNKWEIKVMVENDLLNCIVHLVRNVNQSYTNNVFTYTKNHKNNSTSWIVGLKLQNLCHWHCFIYWFMPELISQSYLLPSIINILSLMWLFRWQNMAIQNLQICQNDRFCIYKSGP